jgi:hypothetical protein
MASSPGMRAWVHYIHPGLNATELDWPQQMEVTVLPQGELDRRYILVRAADGREKVFNHFDIELPGEYQKGGRGVWLPETDPRVLVRLEAQLQKHLATRATLRDTSVHLEAWESLKQTLEFVLRRNGR